MQYQSVDPSNVEIGLTREDLSAVRQILDQLLDREDSGISVRIKLHELAEAIMLSRKERLSVFGQMPFADHGWELLLSLYRAQGQGERPGISALANSCGISEALTLRWIDAFIQEGLVRRSEEPEVGRPVVVLTSDGQEKMANWLRRVVTIIKSVLAASA